MNTIYTFGYGGRTVQELQAEVGRLGAIVVDVRFSPFSGQDAWTHGRLSDALGPRYRWMRDFGNQNYRGGPTLILDFDQGYRRLCPEIAKRPVILLCVCKALADCHRREVALRLSEKFDTDVVHLLPAAMQPKPTTGNLFD